MRVHALNCGCFCPWGARLFHGRGPLIERACIICRCLLVETRAGLVLIDTGLGLADHQAYRQRSKWLEWVILAPKLDESLTAAHQVRRLGFDLRDVRHVICTHLDYDHAGGLADFPQAMVHVSDVEHHDATCRACVIDKMRYKPGQFAHQPRWMTHPLQGEPWMGFAGVRPIPELKDDDLLLVPLPGHTHGHCGVAIRTPAGWLLHAGDAIIHHGELQPMDQCPLFHRFFRVLVRGSRAAWTHNFHRLRQLAVGGRVRITNSHDVDMAVE